MLKISLESYNHAWVIHGNVLKWKSVVIIPSIVIYKKSKDKLTSMYLLLFKTNKTSKTKVGFEHNELNKYIFLG